ncbi:alpha/beta fold hydrolase [Dietzia sp.]|uniref:alpha/beta fold hydrolase n=1 Tax=Dietzia sp. TaxID=1871616 RepID=UPI002FDAE2C1
MNEAKPERAGDTPPPAVSMDCHTALSTDGARIAYRTGGNPEGRPLVLVHGWAQSSLAWGPELLAALAPTFRIVAMDLRGHGASDVAASGYDSSQQWSDDVGAVLDGAGIGAGSGAIILGWSYGGIVVGDHLTHAGTERFGGVVLCGAVTSISRAPGGAVGEAMMRAGAGAADPNPKRAIAALGSFGADMFAQSAGEAQQRIFGISLSTSPYVRAAMFARRVNNDEALARLGLPALVIHGAADGIVLPSAAEANAETLGARLEFYPEVAHAPFAEAPERFLADLEGFASGLG